MNAPQLDSVSTTSVACWSSSGQTSQCCDSCHLALAQESEGEDAEASRVTLPAAAPGRAGKALAGRQSRVRLHEVGPRLELEIVKVG